MNRKATHIKLKGAGLVLALALMAPAAAQATPTRDEQPARGAERSTHVEGTPVEHPIGAATRHRGLGWQEAAIGAGIVVGVLILGLWGDAAVGVVLVGAAALLGAGAKLVTRRAQGDRAWSRSVPRPGELHGQSAGFWPAPGQEQQ